jgi:hypothetical protein
MFKINFIIARGNIARLSFEPIGSGSYFGVFDNVTGHYTAESATRRNAIHCGPADLDWRRPASYWSGITLEHPQGI